MDGNYKYILVLVFLLLISQIPSCSATGENTSSGVKLTTPFPSIEMKGGNPASIDIKAKNLTDSCKNISLKLRAPPTWTVSLTKSGLRIKSIYLPPERERKFTLNLSPPIGEKAGTHEITIEAIGQNGNTLDSLQVLVDITPSRFSEIEVKPRSPNLDGALGESVRYFIDITNRGEEKTINYKVKGNPGGWNIKIQSAHESKTVTSQTYKEGEQKTVQVNVQVPKTAEVGEYSLTFTATSRTWQTSKKLSLSIPATYKLSLFTQSGRLNKKITRGKIGTVQLVISNRGTGTLHNINLGYGYLPSGGWRVNFEKNPIETLKPDSSKTVKMEVNPPSDAIAGDYSFPVEATAKAPYERYDSFDLRVTVSPGTGWGFIGIGILGLLLGGLFFTFWYLGRR